MPIIGFTHKPTDVPAHAVNVRGTHFAQDFRFTDYSAGAPHVPYEQQPVLYGPNALWLYDTHVGLCIRDREANGYDDSDFYMLVWNWETMEPTEIRFASTRGWSYPSYGSSVDATPEVLEAYQTWQTAQNAKREAANRRAKILAHKAIRDSAKAIAATCGFPVYRLTALRHKLTADRLAALLKLLASTRLRSAFKLKLRDQTLAWLKNDAPQYKTPLSNKQLDCL